MFKCSSVKKMKKGFTLVEMLVSILVFSIIISAISGVFVFSIREQKKVLATQELLDQMSYALEYMSRALRMAKKETRGTCLNYGLNYAITTVDGVPALQFINHLQNDDCQAFYLKDGQLKYKKGIGSSNPQTFNLTSNDLNITSFKVNLLGENQTDNLQPRVTFYLEIEGKGFPEAQPKIKIQTSVSQRMLDVQY